jgi:hypothetical protein
MNDKIRKKVSNMQVKIKGPKKRLRARCKQQTRKDITMKEGRNMGRS